ncbi:hypothetical protein CBR_g49322 [Chara braunii]|uniref:Uncharacterized protein n=1 Tax=Chara braunii TaxID=69332 RepID=A0A388M4X6_CHABU|nr:hypothetical protein CBR_g49322 [Chara braunii]|eukprot:GBG89532.1 hypothetical protein CBR_g49322 [Chara braunii]
MAVAVARAGSQLAISWRDWESKQGVCALGKSCGYVGERDEQRKRRKGGGKSGGHRGKIERAAEGDCCEGERGASVLMMDIVGRLRCDGFLLGTSELSFLYSSSVFWEGRFSPLGRGGTLLLGGREDVWTGKKKMKKEAKQWKAENNFVGTATVSQASISARDVSSPRLLSSWRRRRTSALPGVMTPMSGFAWSRTKKHHKVCLAASKSDGGSTGDPAPDEEEDDEQEEDVVEPTPPQPSTIESLPSSSSSRSSKNDKEEEDVPSLAEVDWRSYRAQLVLREQEEELLSSSSSEDDDHNRSGQSPSPSSSPSSYRAQLVLREQEEELLSSSSSEDDDHNRSGQSPSPSSSPSSGTSRRSGGNPESSSAHGAVPAISSARMTKRWAHALLEPEPGCVLIASEELDGYPIFQRSVVLLLGCGANDGPFGVVLNLPKAMRMRQVEGLHSSIAQTFGSAVVHVGGPIDSRHFLVLHGHEGVKGFDEVMKGVYCGSTAGMEHATSLVHRKEASPDTFRFYFGYAGWGSAQLKEEIASGWWYVAACSADLITGRSVKQTPSSARKGGPPVPNPDLWEELLELMGGKYAEISRRARQKGKGGNP